MSVLTVRRKKKLYENSTRLSINHSPKFPPPPRNSITCCRNVDGCNNLINSFNNPKTAICGNCKVYLNGKIEAFPPPPGTCLCCHESPNFSQSIFCSKCSQWLQESGEVDSDWGYWVRDKISGDIICIDYGPPINS